MDSVFNLRLAAKKMERLSRKAAKEEQHSLGLLTRAMLSGQSQHDAARLHAATCISKRRQSLKYLQLSVQLEAVAAQLQTNHSVKKMSRTVGGAVQRLEKALQEDRLDEAGVLVGRLEGASDSLAVQSECAISKDRALWDEREQIDDLMRQVAAKHALDLPLQQPDTTGPDASSDSNSNNNNNNSNTAGRIVAGNHDTRPHLPDQKPVVQRDKLEERLAKLKGL